MPFESKAQVRKCFAAGAPGWDCREWARATPSIKKLPARKTPQRKEALDMTATAPVSVIAALGRQAADKPLVEKFAADTGLAPAAVEKLAAAAGLGVADLARAAYRNPAAFAKFAQAHLGPKPAKPAARPPVKAASALATTFVALAKAAIEKKAAANKKLAAMTLMNHFLDKVAAALPITKQASVRVLQAELALGKPFSFAIKKAYPALSPEHRGIVAGKLVKAASDDFAKFVKKKRTGPETATGKPGSPDVAKMMKAAAPAPAQILERVLGAGRNIASSGRTIAQRAGRADMAAARGAVDAAAGGKGDVSGMVRERFRAGAGPRRQQVQQQVGDRNMMRAGVGGAAGGGGLMALLGGGGGQPAPQPPQAPPQTPVAAMGMGGGRPQRPPTARG